MTRSDQCPVCKKLTIGAKTRGMECQCVFPDERDFCVRQGPFKECLVKTISETTGCPLIYIMQEDVYWRHRRRVDTGTLASSYGRLFAVVFGGEWHFHKGKRCSPTERYYFDNLPTDEMSPKPEFNRSGVPAATQENS